MKQLRMSLFAASAMLMTMQAWANEVQIRVKDFMYNAKEVSVPVGTTVTWINDDQVPHTVAEKNKLFRSAALDTNDKYSYTFKTVGKYEYFCTLHPQMVGIVNVTAGK